MLHDFSCTHFLGTRAIQYYADFYLWEVFFNRRGKQIKQLVELGSGNGGFSTYLLLQCYQRGIEYCGFDKRKPTCEDSPIQLLLGLYNRIYQGDIFQELKYKVIELLVKNKPVILYCDNGDKPKEFKRFVPYLKSGDFVAVHDWGTEFKPEHIIYDNVTEILTDVDVGGITKFFMVV